jgi:hypothetical protein
MFTYEKVHTPIHIINAQECYHTLLFILTLYKCLFNINANNRELDAFFSYRYLIK